MPQPRSSLYNSQIVRLLYRGLFTVSFATVHKKKEESYLPSSMHGIQVSRNTYPTQLSNRPLPIFWKAIYYTNIAAASRFVEGLFPHGAKPGCHQHCRRASTPCRFRLCRARRRLDGDRRREGGGTRWQPLAKLFSGRVPFSSSQAEIAMALPPLKCPSSERESLLYSSAR